MGGWALGADSAEGSGGTAGDDKTGAPWQSVTKGSSPVAHSKYPNGITVGIEYRIAFIFVVDDAAQIQSVLELGNYLIYSSLARDHCAG
jgi:hypothetical protein